MLSVKFSYHGVLRRAQIHTDETELSYEILLNTAKALFPEIATNPNVSFSWEDDERDVIVISSDMELREAVRVMKATNRPVLRFNIEASGAPGTPTATPIAAPTATATPVSTVVHEHVTCDGCGMSPIIGNRYKCSVREDFDLCEACEAKEPHQYAMIKIATPDQNPALIIVAPHDAFLGPHGPWRRGCGGGSAGRGGRGRPHPFGPPHGGPNGIPPPFGPPGPGPHGPGPHGPGPDGPGPHGPGHHGAPGDCPPPGPGPHGPPPPFGGRSGRGGPCGRFGSGRNTGRGFYPFGGPPFGVPPFGGPESQCAPDDIPPCGPQDEQAAPPHPFWGPRCGGGSWRGRGGGAWGGWQQHARDAAAQAAPYVAAADAFVKTLQSDGGAAAMESLFKEVVVDETIDEQMLHEAVRQSLEESGKDAAAAAAASAGSAAAGSATSAAATADGTATGAYAYADSSLSAAAQEYSPYLAPQIPASKPMARFVCDVTFPDNTAVQPGSVFLKTWRVRNDGQSAWPEGVVLTFAGGDVLVDQDFTLAVPAVAAGGEVEVTVQMTAPEAIGRFVTYFRMRAADGQHFGQRLWANILVSEDDAGWHVVTGMLVSSRSPSVSSSDDQKAAATTATAAASVSATAATTATASAAAAPVFATTVAAREIDVDDEALLKSFSSASLSAAATAHDTASDTSTAGDSGASAAEASLDDSTTSVVNVLSRIWAKEIDLLRDMGFTDVDEIIPLLREHIGVPAASNIGGGGADSGLPSAEGMQRIVATLLSRSGKNFF